MKRRINAGFTLLELLTVLAIIVILAGVLFPVLSQARDAARGARCLSNLRQLAVAHQLYVQDWDGRFPAWEQPGPPRPPPFGPRRFWPELLEPYLRSTGLLRCPGAAGHRPPVRAPVLAEYALLTWSQGGRRGDSGEPYQRWPGPPLTESQVVRPAETISLMDGWTTTRWTGEGKVRHSGGLLAAFLDGHVERLTRQELGRVEPDEQGRYWLYYGSAHR